MDRRVIWAIVLMMVIAIAPTFLVKKPVRTGETGQTGGTGRPPAVQPAAPVAAPPVAPGQEPGASGVAADPAQAQVQAQAQTVTVRSELYTYRISTVGGRLVSAELGKYASMSLDARTDARAELVRSGDALLGLTVIAGGDTIPLDRWVFEPSATELNVTGPTPLVLTAEQGGVGVTLTYTFPPDYRIAVEGRVTGLPAQGGLAFVNLGRGLRNTERDSSQNEREYAVVVKGADAERTNFHSLDGGETKVLSGPFEWTAVKSKYFVAALFAFDSAGGRGRIAGVTASAPAGAGKNPAEVQVLASIPVSAAGTVAYAAYAGPLEYDRLTAIGHDFDDVNPYGWPGFRTMVRFFAVPVRWLLVQMHEQLHITYGVVLVLFGLLVRILLWPLNQKAMRANMQMMDVQPQLKAAQEKYKDNPQMLQQEMFRLYKEYNVNPLSGCWPMLLPMPVLFALFFVFQNAIELRGQEFLWLPDLSRPDPLYIIPLLMGISMFGLSKVGQMGMEPNPQMKMMLYVMPVMMTVLFVNFPSGLNLYYTVSNIASIPQQWLIAKERKKRLARQIVEVKTKSPAKKKA